MKQFLSQHFVYSHGRKSKCNMRGKQETLASFLVCSMYSFHILDRMKLVPALGGASNGKYFGV
jgi:hypothetical protein